MDTASTPCPNTPLRSVADTARWVAAIRAVESERRRPLFSDPYARMLAGERGFAAARAIKHPAVRAGVIMRTVVIDRIVLEAVAAGCRTVVSLGAGFDARPWRLALPRDLRWLEVDARAILAHKCVTLADVQTACAWEPVPLDLADRDARRALLARLGETGEAAAADSSAPVGALVLTEGVLGYLEPQLVAELAGDLRDCSACMAWVTDLIGANITEGVRNVGKELRPEDARTRFAPADGTAFFEPHGWREGEYVDFFLDAPSIGREALAGRALRAVVERLPEEKRTRFTRGLGVVRLERVR